MVTVGVIPARLGSTRLSEKVLRPIAGKPMIQHVWERVARAKNMDRVIVACDDVRIQTCVEQFGGEAMLTRKDHPNGTSRLTEVADQVDADVFINIQGDEPRMRPESIDQLICLFSQDSVEVGTLAIRRTDPEGYQDPNVVKVIFDHKGDALYFSRSPIPCDRDEQNEAFYYYKHLGIYGYSKSFLSQFVNWSASELEKREKLEQLRILENGHKIRVLETTFDSVGVDTEEDLAFVEAELKRELKLS